MQNALSLLTTAFVVGGFDLVTLAALGVLGIDLGGVGPHLLEAGFVLEGIAVTGGVFTPAFFVAALFAD